MLYINYLVTWAGFSLTSFRGLYITHTQPLGVDEFMAVVVGVYFFPCLIVTYHNNKQKHLGMMTLKN